MPEVFASTETTIELLSPIDGSTLITIAYVRDLSMSERPVYVERSYSRSGSVTSNRLRSKGSITLRKDAETLALVRELKRWQQGVTLYALSSDLKGKTYRHPNLRLTMTNADGTVERQMAYGVRLSDRTLSRPDGGIVGDSYTLDVLRGFDLSEADGAENYEPKRALDFARTGSATYISTAGTLSTATDGQARIGLPYVVRRNMLESSEDLTASTWTKGATSVLANQAADPKGGYRADKLVESTANGSHECDRLNLSLQAVTYTGSVYAKAGERNWIWLGFDDGTTFRLAWFNLATGTVGTAQAGVTATITAEDGGYYRCSVWRTPGASTSVGSFGFGLATADAVTNYTGDGSSGAYFFGAQFEASPSGAPSAYQATNSSDVDLTNSVNGAGLVLEGAGTNLCKNNTWDYGTPLEYWYNNGGTQTGLSTAASLISGKNKRLQYSYSGQWDAFKLTGLNLAANTTYTISFLAKSPTTLNYALEWPNLTARHQFTLQAGVVTPISFTTTIDATGGYTEIVFKLYSVGTPTLEIDAVQIEQSPFQTSLILTSGSTVTRNPDLCGIPLGPHNLLKYSEQFDQTSFWTPGNGGSVTPNAIAGPDGLSTADALVDAGTGYAYVQCATSIDLLKGKTLAFSLWAKTTTSKDELAFEWINFTAGTATVVGFTQSGTEVSGRTAAAWNISGEWKRYYLTVKFSDNTAGTPNLKIHSTKIDGIGPAGTIYICGAQLVEGYHPGTYVRTTDTAITAPSTPAIDPAWQQNGRIKVRILPTPSSSQTVNYIGGELFPTVGTLRLWRYGGNPANKISFDRKSDIGTQVAAELSVTSAAFYDGAPHDAELVWKNYTIDGTRYMPMELWIDGSLVASQDVAALYGATAWADIDPTKLISDGNVFATLSNLTIGHPTLPAGAIPA